MPDTLQCAGHHEVGRGHSRRPLLTPACSIGACHSPRVAWLRHHGGAEAPGTGSHASSSTAWEKRGRPVSAGASPTSPAARGQFADNVPLSACAAYTEVLWGHRQKIECLG